MLNIGQIIGKFIKNSSERELEGLKSTIKKINDWEPEIRGMSNESFPAKTAEIRTKIQKGSKVED